MSSRKNSRVAVLTLMTAAALAGTYIWRRSHPVVGQWKLDLPASSTGTGKSLILLSDGTGDLDGTAFRYRIVDGKNLVVNYPDSQLYVWPFELERDRLTLTAFKEKQVFVRASE